MVASKLGIAILSTRAVDQDVRSGRLRALTLTGVNLHRPITLIERKQQALTKPAQTFKALLISYCSSHLDQLDEGISPLASAMGQGKQL
jgi:DNA-binding transcriptional LysR family regulator